MVYGLTYLGVVHTVLSLVAVVAGVMMLARAAKIGSAGTIGKVYVWTTVLVCLTGFPIMQQGGFGPAHIVGVVTLVTLLIAYLAEYRTAFGNASRYVATVAYSATFLFHMIPAVNETTTRLPYGNPIFPNQQAPQLAVINNILIVIFLVFAVWQVLRMRKGAL